MGSMTKRKGLRRLLYADSRADFEGHMADFVGKVPRFDDDDEGEDDGEEEDDEDEDDDDDDEEGGFGGKSSANIFMEDDGTSDVEMGSNDYEMTGDKFSEMLEDLEEEERKNGKNKSGKKRGIKRSGGGFKRGGAKKFRKH